MGTARTAAPLYSIHRLFASTTHTSVGYAFAFSRPSSESFWCCLLYLYAISLFRQVCRCRPIVSNVVAYGLCDRHRLCSLEWTQCEGVGELERTWVLRGGLSEAVTWSIWMDVACANRQDGELSHHCSCVLDTKELPGIHSASLSLRLS